MKLGAEKLFLLLRFEMGLRMSEQEVIQVEAALTFKRNLRTLAKRYRSIRNDVQPVIEQLEAGELPGNRISGIGYEVFKLRFKNREGKGLRNPIMMDSFILISRVCDGYEKLLIITKIVNIAVTHHFLIPNYSKIKINYSTLQENKVQGYRLKLLWDGHPCPSKCTSLR